MTVDLDRLSAGYEFRPVSVPELDMARRAIHRWDVGTGIVVEVGSGPGSHANVMRRGGARVVAIDRSPSMLGKVGNDVARICGSGDSLPIRSEVASLVFLSMVIHYADVERWMGEIARILRTGGGVMVWTIDPDHHSASFVGRHIPETVAIDEGRFPRIERIVAAMGAAGMTDVDVGGLSVHRSRRRDAMIEAIRGGFISTLQLVSQAAVERGIARIEAAYPSADQLLHYCTRYTWIAASQHR